MIDSAEFTGEMVKVAAAAAAAAGFNRNGRDDTNKNTQIRDIYRSADIIIVLARAPDKLVCPQVHNIFRQYSDRVIIDR